MNLPHWLPEALVTAFIVLGGIALIATALAA